MNSITPKRHAETLRNQNIPFQLKNRNTCRNGIDNLGKLSHRRSWNGKFGRVTECKLVLMEQEDNCPYKCQRG